MKKYDIEHFELKGSEFFTYIYIDGVGKAYTGSYSVGWDFDLPLPMPDHLCEAKTGLKVDLPDQLAQDLGDLIQDHGDPGDWEADRASEAGDRLNDETKEEGR